MLVLWKKLKMWENVRKNEVLKNCTQNLKAKNWD